MLLAFNALADSLEICVGIFKVLLKLPKGSGERKELSELSE